jgi:hypothetical protein
MANLYSTAQVNQGENGADTATFIALPGLSYTVNVPAGGTYKILVTARGLLENDGNYTDGYGDFIAQDGFAAYDFFLDGEQQGVGTTITTYDGTCTTAYDLNGTIDGFGQTCTLQGSTPWSITYTFTLTAGQHTLELRGANATLTTRNKKPIKGPYNPRLADVFPSLYTTFMNLVIFM